MKVTTHDKIIMAQASVSFLGFKAGVFVYYVDGLLIDTGAFNAQKQLIPFFNSLPIEQVVLTHVHEDHTGMAAWLQKNKNIPIYINPRAVKLTRKPPYVHSFRHWIWGYPQPFDSQPLGSTIRAGEHTFDVITAPGHTAEHIVLHEKNRGWLFTGDLYLNVQPKLWSSADSIPDQIKSLTRILELDFDTVFCAHAGIVHQGKVRLAEKLDYLLDLQARVLKMASKGLKPHQIDRHLFPSHPPITYLSQGEFSSFNMVRSICKPATP